MFVWIAVKRGRSKLHFSHGVVPSRLLLAARLWCFLGPLQVTCMPFFPVFPAISPTREKCLQGHLLDCKTMAFSQPATKHADDFLFILSAIFPVSKKYHQNGFYGARL